MTCSWTFITAHAAVLTSIGARPSTTALEVASKLGITERSVRRILADLQDAGCMQKTAKARVNHYQVSVHMPLRRPEIRIGLLTD